MHLLQPVSHKVPFQTRELFLKVENINSKRTYSGVTFDAGSRGFGPLDFQ